MSEHPRENSKMSKTPTKSYARAVGGAPTSRQPPGAPKKPRALCRNGPSCSFGSKCKFSHDFPEEEVDPLAPFRVSIEDAKKDPFLNSFLQAVDAENQRLADFRAKEARFAGFPDWYRTCVTDAQRANALGERLYPLIHTALNEGMDELKKHGMWCPTINAGEITGMIVELPPEEAVPLVNDLKALGAKMADACEVLSDSYRATQKASAGK